MKKLTKILFLSLLICSKIFAQSTSIVPGGTYLLNNGANNWLQLPVMTNAAITAIIPPIAKKGMMIYDCDFKCVRVFNGMAWNCLCEKTDDAPGCSDARITGHTFGGMTGPSFPSTDSVAGVGDEIFFVGTVSGSTVYPTGANYYFAGATGVITSFGGTAGYVAHQTNAGNIDWVTQIGGTIGGLVADASISSVTYSGGNAYIVGHFSGQMSLSPVGVPTTYTSAGGRDFFIQSSRP